MEIQGDTTLSDLISPTLALVCAGCDRRAQFSVAWLIATRGDALLADLRTVLTANCPKRASFKSTDQCRATFNPPPTTGREKPTW
jgi:hypothetical protein